MADLSPTEVLDAVSDWNLMQVKEFVDSFCEKFDVSADAPAGGMMMAAPGMGAPGAVAEAAEEEKDSFNVVLKEAGGEKIKVIKEVRAITGLGLKEAKELVESAPKPVKEEVAKAEAEELKKQLEAVGATVELS